MTISLLAGAVDTTFDDDGEVLIRNFFESGLALQPDGKIVVAGTVWQERGQGVVGWLVVDLHDYDFALARYNPDGSLDTTFGQDGEVTTHLGEIYGSKLASQTDRAYAVALQPDSKILVAGASDYDFALVRYNADGSLDPTFSGDGATITPIGGSSAAYSIAPQADGRIVVSGGTGSSGVVARYNADGSLDPTFGSGGRFIFNDGYGTGNYYDTLTNLALQPNGKILVAGSRYNYSNGNYDFAVVRINANGTLDSAFGQDGRVKTDISGYDSARSIAVQVDGRIVVAGASDDGFTLVRYNRNGTLDTTFDGDGRVTTAIGESSGAYSIALQADGKIVAAGGSFDGDQSASAFARYNPDGSLDTTFDRDGTLTIPVGERLLIPSHVAIQSDGNIVISEESAFGSGLIRLLGGGLSLSGTAGDDTLNGGPGDDTLVAGRGRDAILGGEGRDSILGGAGNDTVQGMAGNDTIDGGAGNDILFGGTDIDTVSYGSSAGSGVTISLAATGAQISGGAGTDTLSGFERLIGSGFADRLAGNNRDNMLHGLSGNDTLKGGGGADKFVFNTPLNEGTNVDRITDFEGAVDVIRLDNDFFTSLATGSLASGQFYRANGADAANDAGDRIVYNSRSGNLYFDSDGTAGPADVIWFAKLTDAPAITAADFFVIS